MIEHIKGLQATIGCETSTMGIFDQRRPYRNSADNETFSIAQSDEGSGKSTSAGTYLTGTGRDFDGLDKNDHSVKVHVPEVVVIALKELGNYYDSNLSCVARHIIFVNLYGSYDLHAQGERANFGFMPFKTRKSGTDLSYLQDEPQFMRSGADAEPLGKNTENLRLWLPERMIDDIDDLAEIEGCSRSVYIRKALVHHLFGRVGLPEQL